MHSIGASGAIALDGRIIGVINGTATGDGLPAIVGWTADAAGLLPAQQKPTEDGKESEGMAEKMNLTDDQIVTERKLGRRSFLAATGALLLGAAALASGVSAQDAPAKAADPDSKDKPKKKAGTKKAGMKKGGDPDKKKAGTKKKAAPKKEEKKSDPDGARR